MPTTPYARILISVNGGGSQEGGLDVAGGDTIQLSAENISGWTQARWEIYAYPPGWPVPTGWTLDPDSDAIVSKDFVPDLITLEAAATRWGKWLVRLIVNNGIKFGQGPQYNAAGQLVSSDVIDTGEDGWQVISPILGLQDLALQEEGQFGDFRQWVEGIQMSLRLIDASSSGSGGITQLTADVLAGPGSGSQAAYVAAISGAGGAGGAIPVISTAYLTFGSNSAASGKLRFPNNTQIGWRNSGDTGDIPILIDSSNNLLIGSQTYAAATRLWGSGSVGMQANNAGYLVHNGTTLEASAASQTWIAVGGSTVMASVSTQYGLVTAGETTTNFFAQIGPLLSAGNANAALWLLPGGVTPSTTNPAIYADSSGVWINTRNTSDSIRLSVAGNSQFAYWSYTGDFHETSLTTHRWTESVSPLITQVARTSDAAPHDLEIQAQPPYASATTFRSPGNVFVNIPPNTGSPSPAHFGGFDIRHDGTNIISMGEYSNAGTSYGAIWFAGAAVSKTVANWAFLGSAADTYFNAPSASMYFGVAGTYYMLFQSGLLQFGTSYSTPQYKFDFSATAIFHFGSDATTARIQYDSSSASNPLHIGNGTGVNELVGGLAVTTRSTSSSFTLDTTTTDNVVFLDTSGAVKTVTLPTPTNGRRFTIVDSTGSFATNNATLARHASEKINGVTASLVLATAWGIYNVYSDGTDWFVS